MEIRRKLLYNTSNYNIKLQTSFYDESKSNSFKLHRKNCIVKKVYNIQEVRA